MAASDVASVWFGLDSAARAQRWLGRVDKKLLDWKLTLSAIHPTVEQHIDTQLQHITATHAGTGTNTMIEDARSVLWMDAAFNHRTVCPTGHAHLTLALLTATNTNTRLTFALLQSLSHAMKSRHNNSHGHGHSHSDGLVMASMIAANDSVLAQSLNAMEFDVVDLCEILSLYTSCCYANTNSLSLTQRAIDIVLFDRDGYQNLYACYYGLLLLKSKEIQSQNVETIFDYLIELPGQCNDSEIGQACQLGYHQLRKPSEMIGRERGRRLWSNVLDQSGAIQFVPSVGLPTTTTTTTTTTNNNNNNNNENASVSGRGGVSSRGSEVTMTFDLKDLSSDNNTQQRTSNTIITSGSSIIVSPNTVTANICTGAGTNNITDITLIDRLMEAEQSKVSSQQLTELIHAARQQLQHYQSQSQSQPAVQQRRQLSISLVQPFSSNTTSPIYSAENSVNDGPATNTPDTSAIALSQSQARLPSSPLIKYSDIEKYQSFPCIYMRGYLLKSRQALKFYSKTLNKSSLSNLFGSNLTRRYFILNGSFLTYFKSHTVLKPSHDESLDIRQCQIEEINDKNFLQFGFGFEIKIKVKSTSGKDKDKKGKKEAKSGGSDSGTSGGDHCEPLLVLFASNENDRSTWVHLLKLTTGQVAGLNHFLPSTARVGD